MTKPLLTRRAALAAGAAFAAGPALAQPPAVSGTIMSRPIPSSGERLPVIGMGTALVYDFGDNPVEFALRKGVLENLVAGGGRVIDTAPSYGAAEATLGRLFDATGLRQSVFLATKVAAGLPPALQLAQMRASQARMKTDRFELMQLSDVASEAIDLGLLREWKQQGVCKYIGITTAMEGQYAAYEQVLKRDRPDFIQVDYALDNRNAELRLLPAARDAGAAVLINSPFGRNRLFSRVRDLPPPDWAREIGVTTWAQLFLKFILSNPAVTAVIPGTDKPEYALDNLGAGRGRLPDAAMRRRMIALPDTLPPPAAMGQRGSPDPGAGAEMATPPN